LVHVPQGADGWWQAILPLLARFYRRRSFWQGHRRAGNLTAGRPDLVHSDEIHMALLQLWEDSFVEGRCPNCDDHLHSACSVHSGKMMPFDNPLMVVRTETLTSTRAIAVVDGDASMCHLQSCRGRK
jgi:hypothetical protein